MSEGMINDQNAEPKLSDFVASEGSAPGQMDTIPVPKQFMLQLGALLGRFHTMFPKETTTPQVMVTTKKNDLINNL